MIIRSSLTCQEIRMTMLYWLNLNLYEQAFFTPTTRWATPLKQVHCTANSQAKRWQVHRVQACWRVQGPWSAKEICLAWVDLIPWATSNSLNIQKQIANHREASCRFSKKWSKCNSCRLNCPRRKIIRSLAREANSQPCGLISAKLTPIPRVASCSQLQIICLLEETRPMWVAAKKVKVPLRHRNPESIDVPPTKLQKISSACTVTSATARRQLPSCTWGRSIRREPNRRSSVNEVSEFTKNFSKKSVRRKIARKVLLHNKVNVGKYRYHLPFRIRVNFKPNCSCLPSTTSSTMLTELKSILPCLVASLS